ncbi:MAG: acylneuraminate cytidylyltransferase, partial [Treponema sp.]|nr:acylneuraminate cytidylyltransferase [Treponema sp.]
MKTNRVVIIQCRLSSQRFPQKAVKMLGTKTVLEWVLDSMHKVPADRYFVATDEDSFPVVNEICKKNNFECFSGSLEDVLKRFCDLLQTVDAKTVIRATADNPFLFYEAAIDSVEEFEKRNKVKNYCDYLTYQGLPHGSGVEIFSKDSLLKAATLTSDSYDHEHVGPALYNHKDKFKCEFIPAPRRFNFPELRTTIDTYSDYLRANAIINYLGQSEQPYTTEQIIEACKAKSVKYPVVLVPSVEKGHGTGHLHRCLNAAINKSFFVYIPKDKTLEETDSILNQYFSIGLKENQIICELPDETYLPIIITDTFKLTKEQINEFGKNKLLASIDEGSAFSDYCDYLLDIIPSFDLSRKPNLFDSSFIQLPKNVKNEEKIHNSDSIKKVLVCLGGEDPSDFTVPIVKILQKVFANAKIVAIMSQNQSPYVDYAEGQNVEFIKPIQNLKEHLFEYDLVITHYGLTAFESVYAGCGVILLPTTKLHKNLAKKYNFAYLEDEKASVEDVKKSFESENLYPKLQINSESKSLSEFISTLSNGKKLFCPICGQKSNLGFNTNSVDEVISRNQTRTYRRCINCGMSYMSFSLEEDKSYQKSYFFEDYKKQYG